MFNPERLLGLLVDGAMGNTRRGSSRSNTLGNLLGGGSLKGRAGLGLLGVAIAAFEHYQQEKPNQQSASTSPPGPPPPPPMAARNTPPPPPPSEPIRTVAAPTLGAQQVEAALLIRAMIAAAAADGQIDPTEREAIVERARAAGDSADLAWLTTEMDRPVTRQQLVAQTPASLAEQVFAASLLAIHLDSAAERDYLQSLADDLAISAERQRELRQQFGFD